MRLSHKQTCKATEHKNAAGEMRETISCPFFFIPREVSFLYLVNLLVYRLNITATSRLRRSLFTSLFKRGMCFGSLVDDAIVVVSCSKLDECSFARFPRQAAERAYCSQRKKK